MNCKNCKYFQKRDELFGDCKNEKFAIGYHQNFVSHEEYRQSDKKYRLIPPDGVAVEGDEGWGFVVGVDFGCIHFEKK